MSVMAAFRVKKEYLISMFSMSDWIFRLKRSRKPHGEDFQKSDSCVVFISSVEEDQLLEHALSTEEVVKELLEGRNIFHLIE